MTDPPEGQAAWPVRRRLSRVTVLWCAAVAAGLVAWFFFAWLVLDRLMLDAAGEAIGTGLLLLVVVSVVGALLRSNRGA
jgi:hypothetical protein